MFKESNFLCSGLVISLNIYSRFPAGARNCYLFLQRADQHYGPPSLLSNAYRRFSSRWHESEHLPPLNEVKMCGDFAPLPHTLSWRGA
jgi:hypothetical protein